MRLGKQLYACMYVCMYVYQCFSIYFLPILLQKSLVINKQKSLLFRVMTLTKPTSTDPGRCCCFLLMLKLISQFKILLVYLSLFLLDKLQVRFLQCNIFILPVFRLCCVFVTFTNIQFVKETVLSVLPL